MQFHIRLASIADVSGMHRVRNRVRENRLADPQRITEASYLSYIEAGSTWVAEADGRVIGFAALDGFAKRVWALFIDPDAEGAGIGRALHLHMMMWAQEQGFAGLALSTEKETRAARFYSEGGWTEAGTTSDGEAIFQIELPNKEGNAP
jgi:GNAT superfamily N-acetyltransferase